MLRLQRAGHIGRSARSLIARNFRNVRGRQGRGHANCLTTSSTARGVISMNSGVLDFRAAPLNVLQNTQAKHFSAVPQEEEESREWTPESRRTGALALKVGMVPVWDKWGVRHPCTVLWMDNCKVTQVKTASKEGYFGIQVGIGYKKDKHTTVPMKGHFEKAGVSPRRKVSEFRVTEDALLPIGTPITARHFGVGQFVDVCGTSIGKGFQGVMKRHGFKGQPATHGVSKTHRQGGSTGQSQDPGRVFKNKKMPGRMGGKRITQPGLQIHKIDPEKNLIYVRGAVPGHKGNYVRITDTKKQWGKWKHSEAFVA